MPGVRLGVVDAWWDLLARAGLSRGRWKGLPHAVRRSIILAIVGLLALVIFFPLYGFDAPAYYTFIVACIIFIPPWHDVPRIGKAIVPILVLGLFVAYPYYTTSGGALDPHKMFAIPIFKTFPNMTTMVVMAVFGMMAVGLNMVVGYCGLLDLGYVAFYAIGAYTAGWLASPQFSQVFVKFGAPAGAVGSGVRGIHMTVWMILPIAAVLTAIAGVLIGLPTLRLRGDYLAIVTLGFGEILPQVAKNGMCLFSGFVHHCVNLTNGPQGINPIDPPGFGNSLSKATNGILPANFTTDVDSLNVYFYSALGLLLITLFCSIRLRDSRLGRAWVAIREDETAAAAMGIPLMRTKTWAYASGAFFGGVAGAYYASFKGGVFPDDFYFNISVLILCMVIIGGMGNVWGVLLGAAMLAYLDQEGLANFGSWLNSHAHTNLDVPNYEFGIYGVIIIAIMLFRPQGLIPSGRRKAELERGVHDEPLYDAAHAGG